MGHVLSLFTYLLTTSVSGRVPGYPSYYPAGTRVINYPDTAALLPIYEIGCHGNLDIPVAVVSKIACTFSFIFAIVMTVNENTIKSLLQI